MPSYHDKPAQKSLKQTRTEEKRREMNERRHEYSNLIRKRKKSQLLQLKRKCTSTAHTPATFTTGGSSLKNVAVQYIQQPNVSSLQALEKALATTINATILELDTPTQMMELCNTLAQSLQAHASLEECLSASRVFTNLAAMNTATQVIMTATIHDNQKDGVTF
jgi:hypothetical protein